MIDTYPMIYLTIFFLLALVGVIYTLRQHIPALCCLIPVIILLMWFGYTRIGSFNAWQAYQSNLKLQQQAQVLSIDGPEKIVQRMQQHLKKHPESAKGWYLLGRLYASQHQWQLASKSFHHAVLLDVTDIQAAINEIQSLQVLNHQRLNDTLRQRLHVLLEQHPNQPDVLAMLAMDAQLHNDYHNEIKYLEALLPGIPTSSIESGMIRKELARVYALEHAFRAGPLNN